MTNPKHPHHDPSKDGGEADTSTVQNPKEPTQAELDADRAANPDTSEQVSDKDNGGGA